MGEVGGQQNSDMAWSLMVDVGNFRVNSKADIPEALEALKDRPLYAEKWAYFKMVREVLRQIPCHWP